MVTFVQSGWPHTVSDNIKPFLVRRDELSSEQRCLMWGGARVIIPRKNRSRVLDELHGGTHGGGKDEGPGSCTCLVARH